MTDSMFELVSAQLKDVEKAVYGMGEYQFKRTYSHFEVSSNRWFLMTSQQCEKHLKKMFDTSPLSHVQISPHHQRLFKEAENIYQYPWSKLVFHTCRLSLFKRHGRKLNVY